MKNVMITGAGRGIGLALTKAFANNGYKVLATYRSEKTANELLKFSKENSNVLTATADVTDESTFGPVKDQLKKLGNLDILINNSGVMGDTARSLFELNMDKVADTLMVNTLGPMRVSRLAIPFMKNGGTIAQITSLMGSIADNESGGYYDYRMSKTALNMFNKCLSKEFPDITCITLHPGWVQTDMGGPNATVTQTECAQGLYKVISGAKINQSGHFYDFTGKELPW
jgi:NAD(P)-dependent dehydrogenase (short-subunit alcohol dehydrogenase family)